MAAALSTAYLLDGPSDLDAMAATQDSTKDAIAHAGKQIADARHTRAEALMDAQRQPHHQLAKATP